MNGVTTIVTAAGAFITANVDDLVVLTALFTTTATGAGPRPAMIVAGQYLGFGALVVGSVVGAVGLHTVPDAWVGLLGLVPIFLGARALWATRRRAQGTHPVLCSGAHPEGVAALTFANGADNISVYVPLLRDAGAAGAALTIAVFLVLLEVWCAAGAGLARRPIVVRVVERAGHWVVPGVFIAIGLLILIEAGTLDAIISR